MDDAGLCSVVSRLQLGNVYDMSAHARSRNEAAVAVVLELLPIDVGSLLFLSSPVDTSSPGAIEGSIQIGCNHSSIVID